MRDEQDLLNRRKHAMLNQLTSLSALAVETAENLPDVPEVPDAEFSAIVGFGAEHGGNAAEIESDPTIGHAAESGVAGEEDTVGEEVPAEKDAAKEERTSESKPSAA
jgi:hypothetical protein